MSGFFIYGDNGYRLLQSGLQTTELTYNGLIIDNNTVSNTTEGISILSITSSPAAQITNNTLDVLVGDHNGAGFWIDSSSNIDIIGNEVNGGYYGAIVTSYVANQPWEEWDTVGSSNIHIQNNIFNGAASVERYDGAGVAIYGSQVGSITISGNNLDNNANVGVLGAFTGPGTLDARYNYFGNSTPILVKVIAYINRARTPQATVGTIDNDPYYYTADHVRNITGAVSTGDNEATLEFTLTEILSNSTFVGGSLTLGTGTNMTGIAGVALTTGDNVTGGDMGYVVSNLFTGLDVGEYNYAVEYSTSEGTGSLTGSFEIPLVAYGCRDM